VHAELDKSLAQIEKDDIALRGRLRDWVAKGSKALDDAKTKQLKRAGAAKMEEDNQRARQEADNRVAAAHTHPWGKDRVGRVAAADAKAAGQARKANANKQNNASKEDQRNLGNAAAESEGESDQLYAFAMKSLDEAMPSDSPEPEHTPGTTR